MRMIKVLYDCKKCKNFKALDPTCDICKQNCANANIKYKEDIEYTDVSVCFNHMLKGEK